jgi:hypothetical protein
MKQETTLFRTPFFLGAHPAANLPTISVWLQKNWLNQAPPEFWSLMAEIRTWYCPEKYVVDVFVVTIEDDAVVLAVEYEQPGREEWIVELVSNKPIAA